MELVTCRFDELQNYFQNDFKIQELPLARIKKIMKQDEEVKVYSSVILILLSNYCKS